jgi:hypothetical protein
VVTSYKFNQYQQAKVVAADLRLHARAKEAKAIAQLLRLYPAAPNGDALSQRLGDLDRELLDPTTVLVTDDPTDLEALSQSQTTAEFIRELSKAWPKRYKLHDVLSMSTSSRNHVDTRHQDAKDIERDALIIGEGSSSILYGANIGYNGAINAIAVEIAELCDERPDSSAVCRFARVILNASNRTTSGGDAFEAIERFVKPGHLVFIAPDSNSALDPIKVSCKLGPFRNAEGWEWGVRGRTEATTRYLIYALDDLDRLHPLARIQGKCVREFGLPLPLPKYDDARVYRDDGKSIKARSTFECDDGGVLELSGSVVSAVPLGATNDEASLDKALL